MTYREGAYVVDTRDATLAQVLGNAGPHVRVKEPGGAYEWYVPTNALRLATPQERRAAGLPGTVSASPIGCTECADLEAARREAVKGGDTKAITDATVAVRSHFRWAHLMPQRG
ncbi:hypothetical protein [Streptomyces sp. NPDC029704]|uniref:hypothetical protein n=1 Tax=Streptomyces sp. NPDC029704 TaxID=3156920 RepID=UPI0033D46035